MYVTPKFGDLVLVTKPRDNKQQDEWVVGFYQNSKKLHIQGLNGSGITRIR